MDEELEQDRILREVESTEQFLIRVDHITDDQWGTTYTVNAYSDGGQLSGNKKGIGSIHGGTWGCVWTDRDDNRIQEAHGTVLPNKAVGRMGVTNNDSEMIAALIALGNLPDDWRGTFHCDSIVTLARIRELSPHKEHRADRINSLPWSEADKVEMRNKEKDRKRSEIVAKMGIEIVETLEAILWRLGPFKIRHLKGHPTEESLTNGVSPEGIAVSKWNKRCDDMANESKKLYFKKKQEEVAASIDDTLQTQTSENESEVGDGRED